jgi:hypothetical protein
MSSIDIFVLMIFITGCYLSFPNQPSEFDIGDHIEAGPYPSTSKLPGPQNFPTQDILKLPPRFLLHMFMIS